MRTPRYYAEDGKLYMRLRLDPEERREIDIRTGRAGPKVTLAERMADELNEAVQWGSEVQQARIRRELGISG